MIFACAADKVSCGHAVSPITTTQGRNLSAFLSHHFGMVVSEEVDLASPAYHVALTKVLANANPDNAEVLQGVIQATAKQDEATTGAESLPR